MTKRVYNPQIMRKTYPVPPAKICNTWCDALFGVISPSRYFVYAGDADVEMWSIEIIKHRVYKRTATKSEWKRLRIHLAEQNYDS